MKKIKMIYERKDWKALEKYIPEYEEYDKSKLRLAFKIDGTACMIKDGKFYKRYDNKQNKPEQEDWIKCYKKQNNWIYWVPVESKDKYHLEGWNNLKDKKDGTYELAGPKVNANRHKLEKHVLIRHSDLICYSGFAIGDSKERWQRLMETADTIRYKEYGGVVINKIEGFVLWDIEKMEPMFKIRKRDLGMEW